MGMLDARGWSSFHLTFDATRMSFESQQEALVPYSTSSSFQFSSSSPLFSHSRAHCLSPKLMNYIITFRHQWHPAAFNTIRRCLHKHQRQPYIVVDARSRSHSSSSQFLLLYSNDSSNLMTKYRPVRVLCAHTHTHSFHFTWNLLFFPLHPILMCKMFSVSPFVVVSIWTVAQEKKKR